MNTIPNQLIIRFDCDKIAYRNHYNYQYKSENKWLCRHYNQKYPGFFNI